MRYKIFLILLAVSSITISRATDVGGHITVNTTWGTSGSPYYLKSDVIVDTGVTLTIEPGVTVNCRDGMYAGSSVAHGFKVYGGLKAIGTESDSVILTDYTDSCTNWCASGWGGITFYESCMDSECILSYCLLNKTMIEIYNCAPAINHCYIPYGGTYVFYIEGDSSLVPEISYNIIRGGGGLAGICIAGTSPVISHNYIWTDGNSIVCTQNSTPVINYNDIISTYGSSSSNTIDARYNYWGAGTDEEIRKRHYFDNTDYIPFFTEPINYTDISGNLKVMGNDIIVEVSPNPFSYNVYIELSKAPNGTTGIYDINGSLIKTLVFEGPCSFWDGRNDNGEEVNYGTYLLMNKDMGLNVKIMKTE